MTNWPFRVTPPLVDVVDALTRAGDKVHGWALADMCGQTTPNVYRALERLRAAGWVAFHWEAENPEPGRPRRRLYWLTGEGWRRGPALLVERRGDERPRRVPNWAIPLLGMPGDLEPDVVGGRRDSARSFDQRVVRPDTLVGTAIDQTSSKA